MRRDAGANAAADLSRAPVGATAGGAAQERQAALVAPGCEVAGDDQIRRRQAEGDRYGRAVDAASPGDRAWPAVRGGDRRDREARAAERNDRQEDQLSD